MFQRKKAVLFLVCLLGMHIGIQANLFNKSWSDIISSKCTISLTTLMAAAVGIYKFGPKFYDSVQEKINIEIDGEIIRCLIVMLTPNCFIHQLKNEEREAKFQKKARLINGRKRILNRFDVFLNSRNNALSAAHQKQLKDRLGKAKLVFDSVGFIDTGMSFLIDNPYINDYKNPGYIDQIIENRVFESIVLSAKPLDECTSQEKVQRIQSKQNIRKLIMKRVGDLSEAMVAQIDQIVAMLFG